MLNYQDVVANGGGRFSFWIGFNMFYMFWNAGFPFASRSGNANSRKSIGLPKHWPKRMYLSYVRAMSCKDFVQWWYNRRMRPYCVRYLQSLNNCTFDLFCPPPLHQHSCPPQKQYRITSLNATPKAHELEMMLPLAQDQAAPKWVWLKPIDHVFECLPTKNQQHKIRVLNL